MDIVSKSFIKVDEVALARLNTNEWKMLADLEVSIKCRVKNQPDVEVSKYMPVTITTNDNVYTQVILACKDNQSMEAVSRRWAFIRYFSSW